MATIRARRNADGTVMYTAQIRIKRGGAQVYQESASFSRKKAAEAWALRREAELAEPGGLERATKKGYCFGTSSPSTWPTGIRLARWVRPRSPR